MMMLDRLYKLINDFMIILQQNQNISLKHEPLKENNLKVVVKSTEQESYTAHLKPLCAYSDEEISLESKVSCYKRNGSFFNFFVQSLFLLYCYFEVHSGRISKFNTRTFF